VDNLLDAVGNGRATPRGRTRPPPRAPGTRRGTYASSCPPVFTQRTSGKYGILGRGTPHGCAPDPEIEGGLQQGLASRACAARCIPGCPTRTTGVPNKRHHTGKPRFSPKVPANAPEICYSRAIGRPTANYRGAQQKVPGCPTKSTGVPSKKYRGAQQKVPGCPTKSTGVPNKSARGIPRKQADFLLSAAALCIVMFSCCFV
jgi:hypothetical protein